MLFSIAWDRRTEKKGRALEAYEILGRLSLAALCSGLIGYERETAQKAAGLRTHTLVGTGAAIFTVASIIGFDASDESRVAAQIVTGVGFLGAGAIFREGAVVSGLTTAAGLWVVAAIGMAAGAGSYWLAGIGTGVTLITLYGLLMADAAIARAKHKVPRRLEVQITEVRKLEALLKFIRHIDPSATQLDFKSTGEGTGFMVLACSAENIKMVRELLASHRAVGRVEELSALYWPQGTGNRPEPDE